MKNYDGGAGGCSQRSAKLAVYYPPHIFFNRNSYAWGRFATTEGSQM
jgi:hypothetical protein